MRERTIPATAAVVLLLASGCASTDARHVTERTGTLIERDGGGWLCTGAIAESAPPSCTDGVFVEGMDWDALAGVHDTFGTRWGEVGLRVIDDGDQLVFVSGSAAG